MTTEYNFQKKILDIMEKNIQAAIATVIGTKGSSPRKQGSKMIIYNDGTIDGTIGGGAIEHKIVKEAKNVIKNNSPKIFSYNLCNDLKMGCGGSMQVYMEPISTPNKIFVFGGGHTAKELTPLLSKSGFSITLIDDRKEFANTERFPEASEVICDEYIDALPKLNINKNSYIVILTHKHKYDKEITEFILNKDFKYLGMIGSIRKFETIKKEYREKGITEEQIKKIRTPIGLEINAETPFEIAVSIASEIISIHRSSQL